MKFSCIRRFLYKKKTLIVRNHYKRQRALSKGTNAIFTILCFLKDVQWFQKNSLLYNLFLQYLPLFHYQPHQSYCVVEKFTKKRKVFFEIIVSCLLRPQV